VPINDRKTKKRFKKPELLRLTWDHYQVCACGLEEYDDGPAAAAQAQVRTYVCFPFSIHAIII